MNPFFKMPTFSALKTIFLEKIQKLNIFHKKFQLFRRIILKTSQFQCLWSSSRNPKKNSDEINYLLNIIKKPQQNCHRARRNWWYLDENSCR